MRISTNQFYESSISAINAQQSALIKVSQQVSAQRKLLDPADDPVAASREVALDASMKASEQMLKNQADLKGQLEMTENYLNQGGNALQAFQSRLVQAGSGILSESDRQSIVADLLSLRDELLAVANSRDESGNFLFSGYKRDTQPFVRSASGVSYQGDGGVTQSQIGPNRVLDASFSGSYLFDDIPTGKGGLAVSASSGNMGSAVLHSGSISDRAAWAAAAEFGPYSVNFGADGDYSVLDGAGAEVTTGSLGEGGLIEVAGVQIALTGTPAAGDSLSFATSGSQSVFDTLDAAIAALSQPNADQGSVRRANALFEASANVEAAASRLLEARSLVGSSLNEIKSATSNDLARNDMLATEISRVVGADVETVTELTGELAKRTYTVQAAQMTYTRIAQLSIFNYL